ncbi:MAG: hypothetical protein JO257_14890 [Deltaproteobacteria bacterium]|nr:hypothetical protein [Deltaproteobacteria bacterium]
MRAIVVALGLVICVHAAQASTVVVLSEPQNAPALGSALQVTLAGRGVAIATLPAPDGSLRMDRAAAAQHAAISFNADAALWIDHDADATEVCAVSADGRFFRHAPLPVGEGDTPRMFAAIATSLLDELLTSEPPPIDVDVHVHVGPGGAPSVTPIALQQGMPMPMPMPLDARAKMNRTLVEIGPMVSPLTYGAELGLAFPVGDAYRLGVGSALNIIPTDANHILGVADVELRHVGRGVHHFDIGPIAGAAMLLDHSDNALMFGGARFAYAWEHENTNRSISLVPLIMHSGNDTVPGIYASFRIGFAL